MKTLSLHFYYFEAFMGLYFLAFSCDHYTTVLFVFGDILTIYSILYNKIWRGFYAKLFTWPHVLSHKLAF